MTDPSKYTNYFHDDCPNYWKNYDNSEGNGPMNRCALWTENYTSYSNIGFSVCVNIGATKTYYIGIGVDNFISMRIDGHYEK